MQISRPFGQKARLTLMTLYLGVTGATIAACGPQMSEKLPSDFSSPSGSSVSGKIIGGIDVPPGEWIEVVRIEQNNASCTATFVSANTLLTAAHCLEGNGPVSVTIDGKSEGVSPQLTTNLFYNHPGYAARWWEHDLAVVHFTQPVAEKWTRVASLAPAKGNDLTIVGFGTSSLYGQGTFRKRTGKNQVENVGTGRITFRGKDLPEQAPPGEDVLNAPGDSGGPMIVDNMLVGVSSSISVEPRGQGRNGYYTDLNHQPNLDFLKALVAQGKARITF